VSIIEQDYGRLAEFALLFHAVVGERPDAAWLEATANDSYTTDQLAGIAYAYYQTHAGVQAQSLEMQVRGLIEQVWGSATDAQVLVGVDYLNHGGTWAEGLKLLALHDNGRARLADAAGNLLLTKPLALDEVGFVAGAGNDQLFGGAGNDVLIGGSGNNLLDGGAGIDMISFVGIARDYQLGLKETAPGVIDLVLRHAGSGDENIVRNVELVQVGDTVFQGKASQPAFLLDVFRPLTDYVQVVGVAELQAMGVPSSWL
jgi:Ca2+-binding RTX toxin-like protein